MSNQLRSAREARLWFYEVGISMTDWAREHGFPRQAVYAVLSGRSRCARGRGHQIAVALGMKRPADTVARRPPSTIRRQYQGNEVEPHASDLRAGEASQLAGSSTTEEVPP